MSVKVMTWVWEHSRSKNIDRLVLLAIADAADDHGSNAWPSLPTIARKCGGVSTRTISRAVQVLTELGELEVETTGGGRFSNRYRVVMTEGQQLAIPANLAPPAKLAPPDRSVTAPLTGCLGTPDTGVYRPVLEPSLNHPDTSAFDAFWSVYPRREAKAAARKAFDKAVIKVAPSVIVNAAKRYRDDPNRQQAYTAHASTWLNQERWEDDPLPARGDRPGNQVGDRQNIMAALSGAVNINR